MKTYRVYKMIELRATVEAENETEARELAYALACDDEGVEVDNAEDWGIIT